MLEQISYIDDCDTLGQREKRTDIHNGGLSIILRLFADALQTLVSVYQKILEFYKVAYEILTRSGAKLVLKMIRDNERLPNIVQDFLKHAETLRKLVEKATWEVVEDIKTMLYDSESKFLRGNKWWTHAHMTLVARWLGSDKLTLQSQYHASLEEVRNNAACDFLLQNPTFNTWYSASDAQWLALLGDIGSGKTVAMSFLVDELNRRNEYQIPKPKTCYYYCRDDQSGQVGPMFSTLILALLQQLPGLKKTFFEWYKQNQTAGVLEPQTNARRLGKFLETALETLDRPIFVVIDGLDECDRESRKMLFTLLTTLSRKTQRLKILLSSRPEEDILRQLDSVAKIDLTSDMHRDALIVRHIVGMQLDYLSEDVRALIIKVLSPMAQGSAIWTKMAVHHIEIRNVSALGPMRLLLKDIPLPEELSKLYLTMISRQSSDVPENKDLVASAMVLLAGAWRPLSIQELSWAVAMATRRHEVTTVAALAQWVDHGRVLRLVHPFIGQIDYSDVGKRQIRLVHHSVKEFIIRDWSSLQDFTTLTAFARKDTKKQIESPEAFILDVCIRYLLLDEIGSTRLFSEEQLAINELPQEADLFEDAHSTEYDPHCTWEVWEEDMIRFDPTERGLGEFFVYAGESLDRTLQQHSEWKSPTLRGDREPMSSGLGST